MEKNITININSNKYPMLEFIDADKLNDLYQSIFEKGYNQLFPTKINENIHFTDSIKHDLTLIKNKIDNNQELDNKIELMSKLMEDLFGVNTNSYKKGKLGEDFINILIKEKFKNYTLDITRNIPHSGDSILKIPSKNKINKILIEVKNYNKNVDSNEIDKMIYDMKHNKIFYGLMISLNSGFIGKKFLQLESFEYQNEIYSILFLPNINGDTSKIELSIIFLEKLIKLNNKKNNLQINNIHKYLQKINDLYSNISSLKNKFYKIESNIKELLSDYYLELRNFEYEFKNKVDHIMKLIDQDIDINIKTNSFIDKFDTLLLEYKDKKNKSEILLYNIFEIIRKTNLYVHKDIENNWSINNYENKIIGIIIFNNDIINIIILKPFITFNVEYKKDIQKLEKILLEL